MTLTTIIASWGSAMIRTTTFAEPVVLDDPLDITAPAFVPSRSTAVAHYRCCSLGMCAGSRRNYDGNGRKSKAVK